MTSTGHVVGGRYRLDAELGATGMLVGSPEYTAPERLRGTEGLPAGDLFSARAMLYQAIEGVPPFRRCRHAGGSPGWW